MYITKAATNEIPIIEKIVRNTWPSTYGKILTKEQINYMLDTMYDRASLTKQMTKLNHHFLLMKEEDQEIGFISYEHNCGQSGKTKIHKLYVLPQQQGKHVGAKLIEYVTTQALKEENKAIFLNVNRYNRAKEFYLHIGFEIIIEENIDIGNDFLMEDYVLEKQI